MPPAPQSPIDPDLPDNQPLEPGSGPPNLQANPAARIAASEAALGGTPSADAPGGKSSFIAAARRAAQAAGQQPNVRAPRAGTGPAYAGPSTSLRAKMMKRVKSLFIAASIIAIVVGAVQVAGKVFNFGSSITKLAEAPFTDPLLDEAKTEPAVDATAPTPEATASIPAKPFAPPARWQGTPRATGAQGQHDRDHSAARHEPDAASGAVIVRSAGVRSEKRHHRIDSAPAGDGHGQPPAAATPSGDRPTGCRLPSAGPSCAAPPWPAMPPPPTRWPCALPRGAACRSTWRKRRIGTSVRPARAWSRRNSAMPACWKRAWA